jgi:hypothetical protein
MISEAGIHSGRWKRTSRPSERGDADGAGKGEAVDAGDADGAGVGVLVTAGVSDVWTAGIQAEKGGFFTRIQSSFVSATET